MIRIIVAGTRSFKDYRMFRKAMSDAIPRLFPDGKMDKSQIEIISGGADGTDALAKYFSEKNALKYTEFPADWGRYRKAAGAIRNRQMAEYAGPDGNLIAFWDGHSSGTRDMIQAAEKAGLWIRVFDIRPETYGKWLFRYIEPEKKEEKSAGSPHDKRRTL